MEKISIIVPVYNTEKYLEKCIESILQQSYTNFELILVNDGSKDASGSICDVYSKKDKRIVVRHKANGGQSSARNMGLDLATGSHIGFVDSDDWIKPDMYERLMAKAIETQADIVACNIAMMTKSGDFKNFTPVTGNIEFDKVAAMKEIYKNEILTFSPCNKLYRKSLFDHLRFDEKVIFEDKDLSYQLIDRCNKVFYFNDAMYFYRYNHCSTLRKDFSIKRIDDYTVQKRMYEYYCEHYPSFSDMVYVEVFDAGIVLYVQMRMEKKDLLKDYHYLIEFDRNTLKRVLAIEEVRAKDKAQIQLYLTCPGVLILYFELKTRLIRMLS